MVTKKEPPKQESEHIPDECHVPQCERCKMNKPFKLPHEIVHACNTGQLIIFAGAGISTESRDVYPRSFYQDLRIDLKIPKKQKMSFSKVMSLYCKPPKSRKDLLLKIKERIGYVRSFPELYANATEFHSELSTIPHIHEIFTTNWDDFFERECDATPVVTGEDYAIFQEIPGRKVFKIHGSIYNYGSIIATEEDYKRCYHKLSTGIIGAKLKTHLLSKTVVFVGFSFEDEDLKRIYHLLNKEVKGIIPLSYIVTLDENAAKKLHSMKINVTPIITSASFFIKMLKKQLTNDKLMLPDENLDVIYDELKKLRVEHERVSHLGFLKHPDSVYSLFYQDGLKHAFERILNLKHSGQYSDPSTIIKTIKSYDSIAKQKLHESNYPDVAYCTGYGNGLLHLLLDKKSRKSIPMYYLFGCKDILDFKQYLKLEKNAAKYHKAAHSMAVKMTNAKLSGLVFHHRPFL